MHDTTFSNRQKANDRQASEPHMRTRTRGTSTDQECLAVLALLALEVAAVALLLVVRLLLQLLDVLLEAHQRVLLVHVCKQQQQNAQVL